MPYTKKQKKLIKAVAHGMKPTKKGVNMTKAQARKMMKHA